MRTRAPALIFPDRKKSVGWNLLPGAPVSAKDNCETVVGDPMMYVQSLKLLDTLHAQRERERSESIEPDDDDAVDAMADGAFRIVVFNKRPADRDVMAGSPTRQRNTDAGSRP
jgi:hypothetical protein